MFERWTICQRYVSYLCKFNEALRVLREAELDYGFKDGLYLNTALMIVEQMNGVIED